MIRTSRLFTLALVIALFACSAYAQVSTAELHVTVKDGKGAILKNATVAVHNDLKSLDRTQSTNVDGEYLFHSLPPGQYDVTVDAPGFSKTIVNGVVITVGQIAEIPVTMTVAQVNEVVNVTSETEMIETQRTSSTTTIEQQRIENLPTNGRNYINFALTNSQLARDTAPSIGAAPTSGLNVAGQRARSNLVNVDGMDAVDNSTNGIRSTVSQDGVQEFQIITDGYAAEYGRASGGVVNIVTKSGTNDLHGSAFGYLRNRNLQATNPFSTIKDPAYTRAQAGVAIGGPIKKDRTFYFFSFETTRRHESGYSSIGQDNFGLDTPVDVSRFYGAPAGALVLPVTAQQAAILNALPVTPQTQQYATATAVAGVVATQGFNPAFAALNPAFLHTFANLNSTTGAPIALPGSYATLDSLIGNFPVFEGTSVYSLRLDHKLTENQQLTFRAGFSPSTTDGIQVNAQGPQNFGQNSYSRTSRQQFRDFSITGQHTWLIGTNRVNEFRYQFSRRGLLYDHSAGPGGGDVGVNIPGYAFFGREPFSFVKRTEIRNQFTDTFTWTKGKHTIKFGGDMNYIPLKADFTVNFGGIYNFGDAGVQSGLNAAQCAAFGLSVSGGTCLLPITAVQTYGIGTPQNFIQGVGNPHDSFSNKTFGMFLQDSWRISRNLTLNYGARYDVELTPVFPATTPLAQSAQDALGVTQGIPRDYNNIAPRIGLAWDPKGDGKTVVRASFGMFYDHPLLGLAFDSDVADGSQAPQIVLFGSSRASSCGAVPDPTLLNATNTFTGTFASCGALASGLTYLGSQQRFDPTPNTQSLWTNQAFLNQGIPLNFLPFGFPTAKNFVFAYSEQGTFGIEHDFGHEFALDVDYNFNGGRHLNRPINSNAVVPTALYSNWVAAKASGDPGALSGGTTAPLAVGTLNNNFCGVSPAGVPWVAPTLVNFFRRSGLNPSYQGALSGPLAACAPVVNAVLGIYGLGLGTTVPFSDMPANYSSGSSVYHALTVNLRKRFSKKYEFLASYTWSHAIDDSTDLESPLSPQNNYDPSEDRSNSSFDQRHRFVFSGIYKVGSVFKENKFAHAVFSDWTFSPIIEFVSGRPFNIVSGTDTNLDFGTTTDRPMIATSGQTNSCGYTATASKFSPSGFLIPACFNDGQLYGGNLGRNAGHKPYNVFNDLRIARAVTFHDRFAVTGIVDIFNLANKFNVADVNPIWNSAGTPTAAFDPRQFQLALRLTW